MKLTALALAAGVLLCGTDAFAETVTATCKDGSSYSGEQRSGACARHGGVQAWGTSAAAPATSPAVPRANTSSKAATSAPPPARTGTTGSSSSAGQVWVNTNSHVYHCTGDRWYGKTKGGSYMSEEAAKAAGNRPDHGKACS